MKLCPLCLLLPNWLDSLCCCLPWLAWLVVLCWNLYLSEISGLSSSRQAGFLLRKTADFVTTPTDCSWQQLHYYTVPKQPTNIKKFHLLALLFDFFTEREDHLDCYWYVFNFVSHEAAQTTPTLVTCDREHGPAMLCSGTETTLHLSHLLQLWQVQKDEASRVHVPHKIACETSQRSRWLESSIVHRILGQICREITPRWKQIEIQIPVKEETSISGGGHWTTQR